EAHGRADRPAQRSVDRADREGLRPRPLVHRRRGPGLRADRHRLQHRGRRPGLDQVRQVLTATATTTRSTHVSTLHTPQARYVLPEFRERSSTGERIHNPYTKLFEERIIFLGVQIDDASAD